MTFHNGTGPQVSGGVDFARTLNLSIEEWLSLLEDANLFDDAFTRREAVLCFCWAQVMPHRIAPSEHLSTASRLPSQPNASPIAIPFPAACQPDCHADGPPAPAAALCLGRGQAAREDDSPDVRRLLRGSLPRDCVQAAAECRPDEAVRSSIRLGLLRPDRARRAREQWHPPPRGTLRRRQKSLPRSTPPPHLTAGPSPLHPPLHLSQRTSPPPPSHS